MYKQQVMLIIGNGFDLQCKLDSRFKDFIVSKYKYFDSYLKWINQSIPSGKANFDYGDNYIPNISSDSFLFFSLLISVMSNQYSDDFDLDWFDIENSLLNLTAPYKNENITLIELMYYACNENKENKFRYLENLVYLSEDGRQLNFDGRVIKVFSELISLNSSLNRDSFFKNKIKDKRVFLKLFKEFLSSFENEFSAYLCKLVKSNKRKYFSNSTRLFSNIIGIKQEVLNSAILNGVSVLNFNYTTPFTREENHFKVDLIDNTNKGNIVLINMNNVHGLIQNVTRQAINPISKIIIGTDISFSTKNKLDFGNINIQEHFPLILSKTYRKMEMNFSSNETNLKILPNRSTLKHIIFYGHSLNKQDYSYFRAIFDYYDLYTGNVELYFLYSIYDKSQKDEIVVNNISQVFNLIDNYGDGLSEFKSINGKNLLHKLLLEDRLHFKKIDVGKPKKSSK